jgi:hypothetical protein
MQLSQNVNYLSKLLYVLKMFCFLAEKCSCVNKENTVEPGYNDIGLYNISPIASDIL